jgi:hypothetical protein
LDTSIEERRLAIFHRLGANKDVERVKAALAELG